MFANENQRIQFISAAGDYSFLLNKGYPEKPVNELVGNRYRLPSELRKVLYRGVLKREEAEKNYARLTKPAPPRADTPALHIDGYNLLLTCLHYRLGKPMFIANDGFLRDVGGNHGRIQQEKLLFDVAEGLLRWCGARLQTLFLIYLDAPVSKSGRHAERLREIGKMLGIRLEIELVKSADYLVKQQTAGVAVTSDSGIISRLHIPVFDLARTFLEAEYSPRFFDLRKLLDPEKEKA